MRDVRSLPPVDVPIALFYRHRCLVCEDAMRRKRDDQRFKNGHKTCQNKYRRFPHVFDYPGVNPGHPAGVAMSASQTLDSSGSKVAVGGDLPRKMFWRDKAGRGWCWESEDLGEHRLFSRPGDLAARLNERGGKWMLTWPRVFPVQQAEDAGKRLAVSAALAALPPDPARQLASDTPLPSGVAPQPLHAISQRELALGKSRRARHRTA